MKLYLKVVQRRNPLACDEYHARQSNMPKYSTLFPLVCVCLRLFFGCSSSGVVGVGEATAVVHTVAQHTQVVTTSYRFTLCEFNAPGGN